MADYTLTAKLTADARNLIEGFRRGQEAVQGMSDSVTGVGKSIQSGSKSLGAAGAKMTVGITAPLVAAGKAVIGTGMVFDDSMAQVAAVSGATGGDLQRLRDTAKEMGATTRFSASEAADGLNFMAMAGWNTEQMVSGLPGVLSLAAASGADLATTSDIVTDALTAFGLQAKDSGKFADILAAASSKANTDVVMLGESFKYVAPLAGAMKYSAEDVSVALGLMANAGIKGSMAGTSLKTMMANLASPTKQMKKEMDNLGLSLTNTDGTMKTFDEVMGDMRSSFGELNETQQASAASTIFGKEAMAGALSIINASEADYNKLSEAINNSEGAAATMAETMEGTLGGTMRSIQSATEGVAIGFYEQMLPSLQAAGDKILEVVGKIGAMSDESKLLALQVGLIAAAIGPVLMVLAGFGFVIGGIVTAIGFLMSPIGLVIVGLLAFGAAFGTAMLKSEAFRDKVMSAFTLISGIVSNVAATVAPILQNMWAGAQQAVSLFASTIGERLLNVFTVISSVVMTVAGVIGQFVMSLVNGFTSAGGSVTSLSSLFLGFNPVLGLAMMVLSQFGPQIAAGFMQIAALVVPILTTLGTALGQLAAAVIPMVMNVISTLIPIVILLGTSILNIVTAVLPVLLNLFMQLVPVVMSLVGTVIGLIGQLVPLVSTIIGAVVPVLMMLVGVILNIVQAVAPALIAIIGAVIAIFQAVIPIVVSVLTAVVQVMAGIISAISPIIAFVAMIITTIISIIAPIVTFIAGVIASIFKAITPIIAFVTGVFNTVFTVISGVFQTIIQFISSAIQTISNTISKLSGTVSGVFNTIWSKISGVMDNVSSKITGVFAAITASWTGLKTFVSGVFSGIGDNMEALVSRVKGFVNGVIGGINSAIGLINKIPGVSISRIPQLARGTDDWQGGFARMNEGGRGEMVMLPGGSQVIPHDVSMKYAKEAAQSNSRRGTTGESGVIYEGDVNVNIGNFENNTDRDLETLSHDLGWMTKRERGRLSNE